jgi:hypothetical protein
MMKQVVWLFVVLAAAAAAATAAATTHIAATAADDGEAMAMRQFPSSKPEATASGIKLHPAYDGGFTVDVQR